MAAPILVAPTSPQSTPASATLAAWKAVKAGQNLAQASSGDLNQGRVGETHHILPSIEKPIDLALDAWQDLSWPRFNIPESKLASGALLVTHNVVPWPDRCILTRAHPAVRKEGI